jgi:uncharacterized protein YPO0396
MRERYLDLETGITLSIKDLLEFEEQKDVVWEAADEMRSLLEDLAETREEEAQQLLSEAKLIQECLKKYDAAVEKLHGSTRSGGN